MGAFTRSFNKLSTNQKADIDNLFKRWELVNENAITYIQNIKNDKFLPEVEMDILLDILLFEKDSDIIDIEGCIIHNCRNGLKLRGNAIKLENVDFIGTVLTREKFKNYLHIYHGSKFSHDKKNIEEFITDLQYEKYLDEDHKLFLLKEPNRITWVTWDLENNIDPFNFTKNRRIAEEVTSSLGLGYKEMSNKELLAFTFSYINAKEILTLYTPTICDSNTGCMNHFFCPPVKGKEYGFTKTLSKKISCDKLDEEIDIAERPELVCNNELLSLNYFYDLKTYKPCNPTKTT